MTIIDDRLPDLDHITLRKGNHAENDQGAMCIMEAAAWIAGEPWTDHPTCVSPVIGAFLRSWNDNLDDADRQQLKPYITKVVGTAASPEVENRRAWMALDWLVRTYTPAWLRLAGLDAQADQLAGLPEFAAGMDVPAIRPAIDAVRKDARASWDAARDASWDAARDAAGAAAGDAARAAARDAVRPTVTDLQASAHTLIGRMIETA